MPIYLLVVYVTNPVDKAHMHVYNIALFSFPMSNPAASSKGSSSRIFGFSYFIPGAKVYHRNIKNLIIYIILLAPTWVCLSLLLLGINSVRLDLCLYIVLTNTVFFTLFSVVHLSQTVNSVIIQKDLDIKETLSSKESKLSAKKNHIKQLAHQINLISQDSAKSSRSKSEFIASLSHEIKTPIHAIKGFVALMNNNSLPNDITAHLSGIESSCDNLDSLVSELLDISKIESGNYGFAPQPFDLPSVIESVIAEQSISAKSNNLYIDYIHDYTNINTIYSDKNAIKRIVGNLLSNAIKFTNRGGVVITVKQSSLPSRSPNSFNVELSVSDTGVGIPVEKQSTIFNPFYQLGDDMPDSRTGSGLGLFIVERYLSTIAGNIVMESKVGSGSIFKCTFKAEIPPDTQNVKRLKVNEYESLSNVLIVDDRISFINSVKGKLSGLGITCEAVVINEDELDLPSNITALILRDPDRYSDFGLSYIEKTNPTYSISYVTGSDERVADIEEKNMFDKVIPLLTDKKRLSGYMSNLVLSNEPSIVNKSKADADRYVYDFLKSLNKPEDQPFTQLKILNVDDDPTNLILTRQIFELLGADVTDATDGKRAYELAATNNFDLILMDLVMPILNGLESARLIQSASECKNVPIIGLSASENVPMLEKFKEFTVKIISKPFNYHDLLNEVIYLQHQNLVRITTQVPYLRVVK